MSESVKVCLNRRCAGPRGNFGPGAVITVSAAEAKALVDAGAGELVDSLPEYKSKAEAEAEAKAQAEAGEVESRETADDVDVKVRRTAKK